MNEAIFLEKDGLALTCLLGPVIQKAESGVSKCLAVWLVRPVRHLLACARLDRRLALDASECRRWLQCPSVPSIQASVESRIAVQI